MARPRGRTKTARLTVNLDEQAHAALLAIAHQEDASLAWVLRRAIMDFISRQEQPEQAVLPLVRPNNHQSGRSS